jgi:pimeloyl-ACP methyl ester carboxylesterase
MTDGAIVRLRRHGDPDGPRIALSHGNGLAIEAYYPFWSLLLDRFDVILFDVRNHGQNPLHREDGHNWPQIASDFETLYRGIQTSFGAKRTAGIFHSLSSVAASEHSIVTADAGEPARWDPLVLMDPPLFPPPGHPLSNADREAMHMMGQLARRRVETVDRPEAFARQLIANEMFSRWKTGAHLLHARSIFREGADGRWHLVCPKLWEAHIFETNLDPRIWPRLKELSVGVKLVGADPSVKALEMPAVLTHALAEDQGLDYTMIPDSTHFLQLERPERIWAAIEPFFEAHGFC